MRYDPKIQGRASARLKGYDYSAVGIYHVVVRTKDGGCVFGDIVDTKMVLSSIGEIAEDCWMAIPQHFRKVSLDEFQIMPNHIHGLVVITSGPPDGGDPTGNLRKDVQPSTTRKDVQPSTTRKDVQPGTTRKDVQPSTTRKDVQLNVHTKESDGPVPNVHTKESDGPVPNVHTKESDGPVPNVHTRDIYVKETEIKASRISPHKGTLSVIIRTCKAAVTTMCRRQGFDTFGWHGRFYDHIIRDGMDLDRIREYIRNNPVDWANEENVPWNIRMDGVRDGPDSWSSLD